MTMHMFDTEIAERVGVNAAVIYQNIVFWTEKNAANDEHRHDGRVWTYNSVRAWGDLFPYLSEAQIRFAIQKLVDTGLVAEGNFNKRGYDRTKWYAPICQNSQMELSKSSNGFAKNDKPIPDSKPNHKPDSKLSTIDGSSFNNFWAVVPKKVEKAEAQKVWDRAVRKTPASDIIAGMVRYAATRKNQDPQYTVNPATWLRRERWNDVLDAPHAQRGNTFLDKVRQQMKGTTNETGLFNANANDTKRLN